MCQYCYFYTETFDRVIEKHEKVLFLPHSVERKHENRGAKSKLQKRIKRYNLYEICTFTEHYQKVVNELSWLVNV